MGAGPCFKFLVSLTLSSASHSVTGRIREHFEWERLEVQFETSDKDCRDSDYRRGVEHDVNGMI